MESTSTRNPIETIALRLPRTDDYAKTIADEAFDSYDDAYSSEEGNKLLLKSQHRRAASDSGSKQQFDESELLDLLQTLRASGGHRVALRYLRESVSPNEYERERQNALGGTLVSSSYLQSLINQEPPSSNVRYERFVLPALGARLLVDDDPNRYGAWWTDLTSRYPFLEDIQRWHGRVKTDYLSRNQRAIFYDVLNHISNCTSAAQDRARLQLELQECRARAATLLERLDATQKQNDALIEQRGECERGRAHIDETLDSLRKERDQTIEERRRLDKEPEESQPEAGDGDRKSARLADLAARQEALQKRIAMLEGEQTAMREQESSVLISQSQCETDKRNLQNEIDVLRTRVDTLQKEAESAPEEFNVLQQSITEQTRRTQIAEQRIAELEEQLSREQEKSSTCETELETVAEECDNQLTQEREDCEKRFEEARSERQTLLQTLQQQYAEEPARQAMLSRIEARLAELPEDSPLRERLLEPLSIEDRAFVVAETTTRSRAQKDLDEIRNALQAIDAQLTEAKTSLERERLASDKQMLLNELEKFAQPQ